MNRRNVIKKYFIGIVLLVGLGFGVYQWSVTTSTEQTPQDTPQIVKAQRGPLKITVEATGTVEPQREVEIKCEASGEIIKLPIDVSDVVKEGDLLVQLNPRDETLEVKRAMVASVVTKARLEQAKLTLKITQQNLANARGRADATLASAKALAAEMAAQFKRAEQLREMKMTSDQQLQTSRTSHAQAVASLQAAEIAFKELDTKELEIESLRQAVSIAQQDVVTSEIDLDEAQERLRETTVQSPMQGVVTACDVQVGQIISSGTDSVNGGTTVLYLADMSRMYVLVSVDESDIGQVQTGQNAQITVDAFPLKEFQGKVVRIATKGVSSSNVVTFKVKVEVTSLEKELLKPGMTANVQILVVDKEDVLLVPSTAVVQTAQQCYVTTRNADMTTNRKSITIGQSDGDWTEILSGLNEGDPLLITQKNQSIWRKNEQANQSSISSSMLQSGNGQGPSGGPPQ